MNKKNFTPRQKAAVALAALKGDKTTNQISSLYSVSPICVHRWKKEALEGLESIFSDKRKRENHSQERTINDLYRTIGKREVEIEWLKKNLGITDVSG